MTATQATEVRRDKPAPHREHVTECLASPVTCLCGVEHDEITHEQIVAAEMRRPLEARESDPFPDLLGNRTVSFGTTWHGGKVLLSDQAAALCSSPAAMNREEVRLEAELLRHVKAGLRSPGLAAPAWANGMSPASGKEGQQAPQT